MKRAFAAKDLEGARKIIFHDLGKAGLTVDEVTSILSTIDETTAMHDTLLTGLCRASDLPMLALAAEFFEKNDRLATLDSPMDSGTTRCTSLPRKDTSRS